MRRREGAILGVVLLGAAAAIGGGAGARAAAPGELLWVKRFGDRFTDKGGSLALDATGNVVMTGYGEPPSPEHDPGRTPYAEKGLFVLALGPGGAERWSSRFATSEPYDPDRVALDGAGAFWLAGELRGKAAFDRPHDGGAGPAAFLVKLSDEGKAIWSASWASVTAPRVSAAPDGSVLLGGHFAGSVSFGGAPLHSAGDGAGFVARFAPDGAYLWSAALPRPLAMGVDAAGNAYFSGSYEGTLSFGGATVTAHGADSDVFVLSLTSGGKLRWLRSLGSERGDLRLRMAVEPSGVVVVGWNVGAVEPPPPPGGNLQVARLDASGKTLWERTLGGTGREARLRSLAVAADGTVAMTGTFHDTVDLGAGPLTAPPGKKATFVAKLGADGKTRWSRRFSAGYVEAADVLVDPAGRVYASGWFDSTLEVGSKKLTSAGSHDAYVVCFAP